MVQHLSVEEVLAVIIGLLERHVCDVDHLPPWIRESLVHV